MTATAPQSARLTTDDVAKMLKSAQRHGAVGPDLITRVRNATRMGERLSLLQLEIEALVRGHSAYTLEDLVDAARPRLRRCGILHTCGD